MRIPILFLSSIYLAVALRRRFQWGPGPDVDPNTTAYIAFRIQDPKLSERVRRLDEAALNVSLDYTTFIVDPSELVQPLLSFNLEDDDVPRSVDIFDKRTKMALCQHLPRRIPYTEFKVVDNAMMAMSQTDGWITSVKNALLQSLNRHGFIFLSNLDENMVVIANPTSKRRRVDEIPLRNVVLTSSAYVDKINICRGIPPTAASATPCVGAYSFPIGDCEKDNLLNAQLKDFIPLLH